MQISQPENRQVEVTLKKMRFSKDPGHAVSEFRAVEVQIECIGREPHLQDQQTSGTPPQIIT